MTTEDLLKDIYDEYNSVLRPLMVEVEVQTGEFPIYVLNEVRALNDHVARTYLKEHDADRKKRELESARRHVLRATLDCYKVLCNVNDIYVTKFERRYRRLPLGEVDSGKFLPEFMRLKNAAGDFTQKAKMAESLGGDDREVALGFYEEAVVNYAKLKKYVSEQSHNLSWAVSQQKRYSLKWVVVSVLISFLVGCISIWFMREHFDFLYRFWLQRISCIR